MELFPIEIAGCLPLYVQLCATDTKSTFWLFSQLALYTSIIQILTLLILAITLVHEIYNDMYFEVS
jgi:hypothetical protein